MLNSSSASVGTFIAITAPGSTSYTMYTVPAGKSLYVNFASGTYMTGFSITNSSGGGQTAVETPLLTSGSSGQIVVPAGTVIRQNNAGSTGTLVGYLR